LKTEAHLSDALPLALLVLVIILLAAMPWHRPHPNHLFILSLLKSCLEDEPTKTHIQGEQLLGPSMNAIGDCASKSKY
jgi:hypothetical protein